MADNLCSTTATTRTSRTSCGGRSRTRRLTWSIRSPDPERQVPFHADSLSQALEKLLKALNQGLSLHSLRHTFVTWRLEMGDPLVRVQSLTGHADADTLLRYAHVQAEPMHDLLRLLFY
jgi:integrase